MSGGGAAWGVQLLGGFVLAREGVPVAVPAAVQRLVAFLALHGPKDRARTAWTLWPSTTDERALANLRTAIWRLRQHAPDLLCPLPALGLADGVDLDVRRAELPGLVPELLPGWYDDWVLFSREQLRHRMLRVMERAAEEAIRSGDPMSGLTLAYEAVAVDPLRESPHRLVLTALLAAGNVSDALRHADLVLRLLDEQLGVPPSAHLAALIRSARAG